MNDIKRFAESISGKEYDYPQFTKEEIQTAKDNGLVIVYGASDDLMEFDGALYDEGDCYNGGEVYFSKTEVCLDEDERGKYNNIITAIWGKGGISWQYETDIPHETFEIMEDGEVYCVGIVFSIDDLK